MTPITHSEWLAIVLSLKVATFGVLAIAGPGVFTGWLLARKQFWGKSLVDAIAHAPLVLPPVVTGYFLLIVLGRRGWIGAPLHDLFGVRFAFHWTGAALAAAVMAFPLLVRSVRLAIELIDQRMEQAAAALGAGPARVWFQITLPLAMPGVVAGAALAFARSLGEFGATITFAGNIEGQTRTLSTAIYNAMQVPGNDAMAFRLAALSTVLSIAAVFASEWMARRVRRRLGPDWNEMGRTK